LYDIRNLPFLGKEWMNWHSEISTYSIVKGKSINGLK